MAVPRRTAITLVIDVDGVDADAETVDALARIALVARGSGMRVALGNPSHALLELIAFCGLGEVLPAEPG